MYNWQMNTSAYLDRIGYSGSLSPCFDTLSAIHRAHMYSVPFENLDIALGNRIEVSTDKSYKKIVGNGRGGFCYELNGLFCRLLRALGFEVQMLSARVFGQDGKLGPEFDHLLLRVGNDVIADVGFGDSFVRPKLFNRKEQSEETGVYRFVEKERVWSLEKMAEGGWTPEYEFTTADRELEEFEEMCTFQQISPDSIFTKKVVCSLAKSDGRVTYANGRLIETRSGAKTSKDIQNESELRAVFKSEFGFAIEGDHSKLLREPKST